MPAGVIKDYPLVSSWFISIAKNKSVVSAIWKASDDVGYSAYHQFILHGKKSAATPAIVPQVTSSPGAALKVTTPPERVHETGKRSQPESPPAVNFVNIILLICFISCFLLFCFEVFMISMFVLLFVV